MKKIIIITILLLLASPILAEAQSSSQQSRTGIQGAFDGGMLDKVVDSGTGYKSGQTPEMIIGAVIKTALSLVGMLFLVLMVYGGYLWMVDRGNNSQVEKAKGLISAAVIGLIIVLGAYAVTYFVVETLETQVLDTGSFN